MSSGSGNKSFVNMTVSAREGNVVDSELKNLPNERTEKSNIEYDCFQEMKIVRQKHPRNIIIGYININSIRNKFQISG